MFRVHQMNMSALSIIRFANEVLRHFQADKISVKPMISTNTISYLSNCFVMQRLSLDTKSNLNRYTAML